MPTNQYICVSGNPTHEELRIDFPSGIFNVPLQAELASINATFGFNQNPHRFELEYIPENFNDTVLPPIGSGVQFTVGPNFLVQGRITHADFNQSANGNVISISVEDIRIDLSDVYIDTFGVYGTTDTPTKNVVDIRYWYLKNFAETRVFGRNRIVKDLRLLDQHGASYKQIYDAIKYFEEQVGTINDIINKIPHPDIVESQLPFDPDGYRWQFRTQPLLDVLVRILGDVSFDFYWNMSEQKVNVINRKFSVNIDKDNIPIPNDPAAVTNIRYGNDRGERATTVVLYGAKMEGLIGSVGKLKSQSGAYGISSSGTGHDLYDLGITPFASKGGTIAVGTATFPDSSPLFVPGWRGAQVKYYGPDGSLRIDKPTDRELKAALKGIEYWTLEKNLDNRIDAATIDPGIGTTQNQAQIISQSGLGLIDNRGQPGRSWVLEWYNRIRNFAQNHFARTYILHKNTSLYDELDNIDILPAAWCNIENLVEGGTFEDDYKVQTKYRFLSVFWDHDNNKMRPWADFKLRFGFKNDIRYLVGPKWGPDGKGIPGQWEQWNEDQRNQYVPIEVKKWNRKEDIFDERFLQPKFDDEKGLMIRLPNTCWESYDEENDTKLLRKPILAFFSKGFVAKTQVDIITDPLALGSPYETISNVALPVQVDRRYGFGWPSPWASGTGISFELDIREDLAPWEFQPRGFNNSWELMQEEAKSSLASRVVNRDYVTFAEISKLGLPIIGFDNFADQSQTDNGYGIVSHGITNINVTKNQDWWQTKYSVKSHFPQFVKIKPVQDEIRENFDFVIRRLEDRIPGPNVAVFQPPVIFNPETPRETRLFQDTTRQSLSIPVTINQVLGRDEGNEYYVGKDDRGTTWPSMFRSGLVFSSDSQFFQQRKARATDGFLQVGMRAIYHFEEQEDGSFVHYFTGGFSLSAGRIIELTESPKLVEGVWRANIRTIEETVTDIEGNPVVIEPFEVFNVPFLNQSSVDTSLVSGDKLFMGGNGNDNQLQPDIDVAVDPNKDKLHLVNTSVPSTVDFAVVTTRPDTTTGLGGAIISSVSGDTITDGAVIGGKTFNVRFVGVENDQVAVGDPCITIQGRDPESESQTRVYCFIMKALFAPFSAAGPGSFLT